MFVFESPKGERLVAFSHNPSRSFIVIKYRRIYQPNCPKYHRVKASLCTASCLKFGYPIYYFLECQGKVGNRIQQLFVVMTSSYDSVLLCPSYGKLQLLKCHECGESSSYDNVCSVSCNILIFVYLFCFPCSFVMYRVLWFSVLGHQVDITWHLYL